MRKYLSGNGSPIAREALENLWIVEFSGEDQLLAIPEKHGVQVYVLGPGLILPAIEFADKYRLTINVEPEPEGGSGLIDLPDSYDE